MRTNTRLLSREGKLFSPRLLHDLYRTTLLIQIWIFVALILTQPVLADNLTIRGAEPRVTLEYHVETSHLNDPLKLYVEQGDTLYQGKTYDLSGASGISYMYAHWNDWKTENTNCNPDQVNDIWYIRTGTNERAVYLDPAKWHTGDWYYWDWWECNLTHYDYTQMKTVKATGPIESDNKFAFKLVKPLSVRAEPNISIDTTVIPVQAYLSPYAVIPTTQEIRGQR
jgi:hypothetical protein